MTDALDIAVAAIPIGGLPATGGGPQTAELLSPATLALQGQVSLAATVLGRDAAGALLLRSDLGLIALQTPLPLAPGARIDLRPQPGSTRTLLVTVANTPAPAAPAPPTELDLGTEVAATLRALPQAGADGPPIGTQLLLRIFAPPDPQSADTLLGTVTGSAAGETMIETPLGTLAITQKLAIPPGTVIAFAALAELPPSEAAETPPSQAAGWPTLDTVLAALETSVPALAHRLRTDLAPGSPAALAGTLLFLARALYNGRWPSGTTASALTATGHDHLRQRLEQDIAELNRLGSDPATGDWRALTLPLLTGPTVQPLHLFLRRPRRQADEKEDGARFVLEAELDRLGRLQLDAMVRQRRFDLAIRSQQALAPELRQEITVIFARSLARLDYDGDLVFSTAPQSAVSPLAPLRKPVAVTI